MALNPIDAPIALDLKSREAPGGANRSRRASLPAAGAPGQEAGDAGANEAQAQQLQQQPQEASQPQAAAVALNMNLKFSTDENTGKLVVSVVDPNDGKVLRQMPSAEALKVAEAIGRYQGMFIDVKV
jgi:flagellar protein FlaG